MGLWLITPKVIENVMRGQQNVKTARGKYLEQLLENCKESGFCDHCVYEKLFLHLLLLI